ncbi:MAG TPA: ABC transporter permease, partial [Polyangiales bacterium]|nr:ABC transporter permease [Polyangiales bacterium]
ILMAPISLPTLVLASASWGLLGSLASALAFIGGGAWLYGIPLPGNLASGLLIIVLTTLVFVGIGVLSASFTMVWKRGDPIGPLISATFFLLGGIIYPPKILPSWISWLSQLLPVTHGVEALRRVLLQGHTLADVRTHVLILAGFAVVLLPGSLLAFGLAVRRATRDGTLLQF